jgi:excisionase family DNA binding protein
MKQPTVGSSALTREEEAVLRSGGLRPDTLGADERYLLYRATAEYADLLRDSYTVEQAARQLGVNGGRVRQRLARRPRSLYGIRVGRTWRIPRFQFEKRRLVPGIEVVLPRLAKDLHPVAVYRWFTLPNQDLTVADDHAVSPLEWLRSGNPPQAVAELAAEL